MTDEANRPPFKSSLPSAGFGQLRTRLDLAQLEQTISALHQTLPAARAKEAEETMRRMFERAKRWETETTGPHKQPDPVDR